MRYYKAVCNVHSIYYMNQFCSAEIPSNRGKPVLDYPELHLSPVRAFVVLSRYIKSSWYTGMLLIIQKHFVGDIHPRALHVARYSLTCWVICVPIQWQI